MKRFTTLLYSIFILLTLSAQDIIITKESNKIEAKIVEISKESIKYVEYNNQNGPIYILTSEDISSIIFATGQVKVYNDTPQADESVIDKSRSESYKNMEYIARSGDTYYHSGVAMRDSTYASFLRSCPEAYAKYSNGYIVSTIGWGLLAVGFFLNGIAIRNPALFSLSGALEIACIPTLIIGYNRMHDSANIYNMSCANKKTAQLYWSINSSNDGIGIALHF